MSVDNHAMQYRSIMSNVPALRTNLLHFVFEELNLTELRGTTKKSSHPVPSRFILLWESHPVPFLELSCPVPSVPSVPSIPSRLILLLVEKRSKEFILSSSMQIIHFTIHLFQNNIYTTIFLSHKNNFCSTK
jgi:hypothetical protein